MVGEHLNRRMYVFEVNATKAKAKAQRKLREQGHMDPLPELRATATGLVRPGSYDYDIADGYGNATEIVGETMRRYAIDVLV